MIFPGSSVCRTWLVGFLIAISAGLSQRAGAISINGEGPDTAPLDTGIYDRFIIGSYPGAPLPNPTFIGASFDLSGIGWLSTDRTHSITLVSPQYFVTATHYPTGVGATLQFFGTDLSLHSAVVESYQAITYSGSSGPRASDLTLGRLTAPLGPEVTPMPIFYLGTTDISMPASLNQYKTLSLYNYGHKARMGTNELDYLTEFTLYGPADDEIGLIYDQDAGLGETLLEGGDSGSPTLAYRGGVYGLIGTHSGVNTAAKISVDAFVSYTSYVNQINAILANDGQTLTFAAVPEPGTALVGLALLGISGARRFRRI